MGKSNICPCQKCEALFSEFLGKIVGSKVVWIDSITNVERISLSGRMVRYIADLFLVQWPELAGKYKNVEFVGTVV